MENNKKNKSNADNNSKAYTKIDMSNNIKRPKKGNDGQKHHQTAAVDASKRQGTQDRREALNRRIKQKQGFEQNQERRMRPAVKRGYTPTVNITPLGGIEEIGKNMTLIEYEEEMLIIDCGLGFPDNDLFGIDIVIPDFTYAVENKEKIKGLLITHGHEDHIGAIPYFLKEVNVPVFGTKLTLGLIEAKLKEHGMTADLQPIKTGQKMLLGSFTIEPIQVNHSIPDSVAFSIDTPVGLIIHTGDFKIDYTPIVDGVIDLRRFGELGSRGVLLLMSDSTNAERFGNSLSERVVGDGFERLFSRVEGKRVVIATFASNIQRVQQIIDLAERHNRKVAISGRSMENYSEMAAELGYLDLKKDILIDIANVNHYRPDEVIIITTGSQGEPMSALTRMANGTHKQISISSDDFVIISATPVPGNERTVTKIINELLKLGSEVIYESMYEVHASGHACRDDLKLMLNLIKPKFFVPVHGEYKHLVRHMDIALSMDVAPKNVIIPAIGQTLEVTRNDIRYGKTVPSGRVLVDGLGVGDVGSIVLRDRKHLAQDGLVVVVCSLDEKTNELISGPDLISRGFVFVKESEELFDEAKELIKDIVETSNGKNPKRVREAMRIEIREGLGKLMYHKTKRNPMILPIIMEI